MKAFAAALLIACASAGYTKPATKETEKSSWGRDQELNIDESYGKTNAKSYKAESYDEWDNKDNDKWGAQAWNKGKDAYGASSNSNAASSSYGKGYGKGYDSYGKPAASADYSAAKNSYD
jgi:hypothetical protein